jgi:seryl-tRNA synthetase
MGAGAQLARALINFMLQLHTTRARLHRGRAAVHGEHRVADRHRQPAEVRGRPVQDAGDWDLYLVPTAEVPLTNMHRGEILDGRSCRSATPPTRRASAARRVVRRDVRGLIRQHQFDKVELMASRRPRSRTTSSSG